MKKDLIINAIINGKNYCDVHELSVKVNEPFVLFFNLKCKVHSSKEVKIQEDRDNDSAKVVIKETGFYEIHFRHGFVKETLLVTCESNSAVKMNVHYSEQVLA